MKGFWKWFFIVLGALVILAIAFGVTLFFLQGGSRYSTNTQYYGMMGDQGRFPGIFGGMMLGMGFSLLFRGLLALGVLVLAGFGVAYLVNRPVHRSMMPAAAPVCRNCGKPLAPDWRACPHCGTAVQPEEEEPAAAPTKKAGNKKA